MPRSNTRSFMQVAGRAESESTPGPRAKGGGKPSKDPETAGNNIHFEPFEKRAYDMSYACLLIPRDPAHLLTGKIAEFVHDAVRDTCGSFGWPISILQVRPEYVQWVVSAPVGTPPSKCIRTIREQTSKGVLGKFKELRDKNPYQDFWAPGYLVLVSAEAHSQSIIEEFIHITRRQQGLLPKGG